MTELTSFVGTGSGVTRVRWDGTTAVVDDLDLGVSFGFMEGVRAIALDTADDRTLYVGTNTRGVLASNDGGESWTARNEGLTYLNVWSIAQHPTTGTLYAGTEPANLFRSDDRGVTWARFRTFDSLPETKDWFFPMPPHVAHVRGITLRPDDPDEIFCAIEDGWLVHTTDGGRTWRAATDGLHVDAHQVVLSPADRSRVLVATGGSAFRSDDGGTSFRAANEGLERPYLGGIVMSWTDPDVLLTVASDPPGSWFHGSGGRTGAFRSLDGGRSWTRLAGGLDPDERWGTWALGAPAGIAETAVVGLADGRIYATTDMGDTFELIAEIDDLVYSIACRAEP